MCIHVCASEAKDRCSSFYRGEYRDNVDFSLFFSSSRRRRKTTHTHTHITARSADALPHVKANFYYHKQIDTPSVRHVQQWRTTSEEKTVLHLVLFGLFFLYFSSVWASFFSFFFLALFAIHKTAEWRRLNTTRLFFHPLCVAAVTNAGERTPRIFAFLSIETDPYRNYNCAFFFFALHNRMFPPQCNSIRVLFTLESSYLTTISC